MLNMLYLIISAMHFHLNFATMSILKLVYEMANVNYVKCTFKYRMQ